MITKFATSKSPNAGTNDCILQPGIQNDPTDVTNGNKVITGTVAFPDGTNGAEIYVNITANANPGVQGISQIDIQEFVGGTPFTVYSFTALALTATGIFGFQIQPAAQAPGGSVKYTGVIQGAMPNQFQILVTMVNRTDNLAFSINLHSTW